MSAEDVGAVLRDVHAVAHWLIEGIRKGEPIPGQRFLLAELRTLLAGMVEALTHDFLPVLPPYAREKAAACQNKVRQCLAEVMVMEPGQTSLTESLARLQRALHEQRILESAQMLPALEADIPRSEVHSLGQALRDRMKLHGVRAGAALELARPAVSDLVDEARVVFSSLPRGQCQSAD